MNVFCTGVENPITILTDGVPEEKIRITATGATLEKKDDSHYNVRVTIPGEASVKVFAGDSVLRQFKYWVKRLPDPNMLLGGKYKSRHIKNGIFKVQTGLATNFQHFDYDVDCQIVRFRVTRFPCKSDPESVENQGPRFEPAAQRLISRAQPGDQYMFEDIRVKCPGDVASREIEPLSFQIQ